MPVNERVAQLEKIFKEMNKDSLFSDQYSDDELIVKLGNRQASAYQPSPQEVSSWTQNLEEDSVVDVLWRSMVLSRLVRLLSL